MKRIERIIIIIILLFLSACEKEKEYVYFNYGCNNKEYYKCELKKNRLNCDVKKPTCENKEFLGWYEANNYVDKVDLYGIFQNNTIIYARFKNENGEIPSTIEEPSIIEEPSMIVDEPSSIIEESSLAVEEPSSSKTVLPTTQKYKITFNSQGGSKTPPSKEVTYNGVLPNIESLIPSKVGYTFMGWYDKTDYTKGVQYYNATNVPVRVYNKNSNITLYAGWRENVLSIVYNGNGGVWNISSNTYTTNIDGTVILKSTKEIYKQQLKYNESLSSVGLIDYDGIYFNWKRNGYKAERTKEYIIQNRTKTTILDQNVMYSAKQLASYDNCDLSKNDCEITLKVNWKKITFGEVNFSKFKWSYYGVNQGPIRQFVSGSTSSYAIWAPENVNDLNGYSLPLIIWLHGSGETDVAENVFLDRGLPKVISNWNSYNLDPVPAIIVAPQDCCGWWDGHDRNARTVRALVEYAIKKYKIDTKRIVLIGHSMGGHGAIQLGYTLRDINFYAIVHMSSTLHYHMGEEGKKYFRSIKFRSYGEKEEQKAFVNWLEKPESFTLYKGAVHGEVPRLAFTEDENKDHVSDLMYWLFGEDAVIR